MNSAPTCTVEPWTKPLSPKDSNGTQVDGCAVPGGNPEVYTNGLLLPYRVFMSAKRSC